MLDIQFIRDNAEAVKTGAENKGFDSAIVDELLDCDEKRRELITQVQVIRTKRNEVNRKLKRERDDALIAESKELKNQLKDLEPALTELETTFANLMLRIPNVPHEDVPVGKDESGNVTVSTFGEKPRFDFEVKDHVELGLGLDIVDFDRGSKVAGYRGYFLKNQGVMMHMAVMRYALDKLVGKGFVPMLPPIVDRKEAFVNSGHLPWGLSEMYAMHEEDTSGQWAADLSENYQNSSVSKVAGDHDTFLSGTAEVPLVSYHAGEILKESELPKLYAGFSPCYRSEIGSYGKDTKGMYRVHEFMKIEQVILCAADMQESISWHEKLRSYAEEMLQELGLHYRVLLMCTGDMGEPQVKKYDLETWMPGRQNYGETMSDSIMGDFQSRRANIRYQAKDGELKYVHMLNNTALASPRILIALWENYQQADGSIKVPEVLVPYCGFEEIRSS